MKEFFKHLMTGVDNTTFDVVRVGILLSIVGLISYAAWDFYINHKFDPQSFGLGAASILGGGGAGVALKKDTEPKGGGDA